MQTREDRHDRRRERTPRRPLAAFRCATLLLLTSALACSCSRKEGPHTASAAPDAAPSALPRAPGSSAAALASGVPLPPQQIAGAVNPDGLPAYTGQTGTVRGTVRVTGDRAPVNDALKFKAGCELARDMYAPLFREGMERAVADVLVTVTGYKGYLPAQAPGARVEARDCTWGTRTVALTYGQRLEVLSKDQKSYMPRLAGGRNLATLVLVPGGDPVHLYPERPGRYALTDRFHDQMHADVFVVKFATFDVTQLDGKYEISGVPVGDVTVSALLPAVMQVSEKKVRVTAQQPTEVNIELPFDRKAWETALKSRAKAEPRDAQ